MDSGSREQIGHSGSRRTLSSVNVAPSASYSRSFPISGSPAPVTSLMASVACSMPIVPGSTPTTPFAPQDGASSAGGAARDTQPDPGPPQGAGTCALPAQAG